MRQPVIHETIARHERWLLAAPLLLFALHVYWLNCIAEDAYITYRYARHLAEGHGFVWNVGEPPVEGFTSFLWVVLCAAAYQIGLDPPRFTQWIGLLAGATTLLYTYRFARRVLEVGAPSALFATTLCAAAGPLATWAGSGMETAFFGMGVLVALFHASRYAVSGATRDVAIAALSLFVATLTRPEGFGVFAIVVAAAAVFALTVRRGTGIRGLLLLLGIYLPLFVVYFAWRYQEFGYPLPNTFYAKTGGGFYQFRRGTVYSLYFAFHFFAPCLVWVIVPLMTWARRGTFHVDGWISDLQTSLRAQHGALLCAAVGLAYTGYIIAVGGDYMAMYRFFVPLVPLMYALTGRVVQQNVMLLFQRIAGRRYWLASMAALSLGGVAIHSTPVEARLFAVTPGMHGNYRGVEVERWHVRRFFVIAAFFDREKASDQDSLLTYDIGVTGYVLRMPIFDVLGIVDPAIAHQSNDRDRIGLGLAGHEKQDLAYSFRKMPTFFMYTVQLRPAPADWPRLAEPLNQEVRRRYAKKSVWLEDRENRERGYFTYLQRVS